MMGQDECGSSYESGTGSVDSYEFPDDSTNPADPDPQEYPTYEEEPPPDDGPYKEPEPQPAPEEPAPEDPPGDGGDCDPSYPDTCIPPYPPDLDCPEVDETDFTVEGDDPHGFDRDRDGVGCES